MSEQKVYTATEIAEQLAEAKRCKAFVDVLNGDTPCLGVTDGFLDGALNVGLSAAVRLGEIVEQLQGDNARQCERLKSLAAEWMKEPSVCDKGHHCDQAGNGCGASSCFAADLRAVLEEAT